MNTRRATPVHRPAGPGRFRFHAALVAVLGLLGLGAFQVLRTEAPDVEVATASNEAPPAEPPRAPEIVREDKGSIQLLERVQVQALPAVEVQPLFDAGMRVKAEETTKLRFVARDRASGKPESSAVMTASLLHGKDPALPLQVEEVDDGVFEVPITPHGPGRFDVVLSANGVPVGSQRVGVAGAVGVAPGTDDFLDFTADERAGRARPGGRGRRR
jgi:hypothetical protein